MEDDKVAPQDAVRRNSPVAGGADGEHEKMLAEACYWNDKKYSDGATVCDAGQRYKCWNGKWVDIGNC